LPQAFFTVFIVSLSIVALNHLGKTKLKEARILEEKSEKISLQNQLLGMLNCGHTLAKMDPTCPGTTMDVLSLGSSINILSPESVIGDYKLRAKCVSAPSPILIRIEYDYLNSGWQPLFPYDLACEYYRGQKEYVDGSYSLYQTLP
jgi:hypothetical protein